MARTVIWTARAQKSRADILAFWKHHTGSPRYSERIEKQIRATIARLKVFPGLGRIEPELPGVRSFLVLYHLRLFYTIFEDQIALLEIWDLRQDPQSLRVT